MGIGIKWKWGNGTMVPYNMHVRDTYRGRRKGSPMEDPFGRSSIETLYGSHLKGPTLEEPYGGSAIPYSPRDAL